MMRLRNTAIKRAVRSAVVSFLVTYTCIMTSHRHEEPVPATSHRHEEPVPAAEQTTHGERFPPSVKRREILYVGLLSTEKFLQTRVRSVMETWGRDAPRVDVFIGSRENASSQGTPRVDVFIGSKENASSQGTPRVAEAGSVPVIRLKADDTTYPPVDKTFYMLQHVCEHDVDGYDWYGRADDDVYIKMDKLKNLLRSLEKDAMVYLGQPGTGGEERIKRLFKGHSYCMGGPGVVMSRVLLTAICPHLEECRRSQTTGEDDVELGICIHKHLGVSCIQPKKEMEKLFHHSYIVLDTDPAKVNLDAVEYYTDAITLHPAKVHKVMSHIRLRHQREVKSQREVNQELGIIYDRLRAQPNIKTLTCDVKDDQGQLIDGKLLLCNDSLLVLVTPQGDLTRPSDETPRIYIHLMFDWLTEDAAVSYQEADIGYVSCDVHVADHVAASNSGSGGNSHVVILTLITQRLKQDTRMRREKMYMCANHVA